MTNDNDVRFFEAVSAKNYEEVERLFAIASRDAHRLYMTTDEFTPLHYANSAVMVGYCVSSGVDVNARHPETDETPLLTAVKLNKPPSVIRELLKRGASVEVRNKYTLNTPLNQAMHIANCIPENVQALLEYGADANTVNKYGGVPLQRACQTFKGDVTIVEQLLKWGACVNRQNLEGHTPLSLAVENRHFTAELLCLLLKFNAKVDSETVRKAMKNHRFNLLNILSPLLQHANITNAEAWRDILKHVFELHDKSKIIRTCGMLIIKQAFLQCVDPQKTLFDCLHVLKKRAIYLEDHLLNESFPFGESKCYGVTEIEELKSFADSCLSEVEHMKTYFLVNNTSIYEIIRSKSPKVCLNNTMIKVFEKKTFPIYSDIILNKIKRASLVDKFMSQEVYTVVQHGDNALRIVLDTLSVSSIAEYLNEDEIKSCVDAFSNPSEDEYCFWDKLVEIEPSLSKKNLSNS